MFTFVEHFKKFLDDLDLMKLEMSSIQFLTYSLDLICWTSPTLQDLLTRVDILALTETHHFPDQQLPVVPGF